MNVMQLLMLLQTSLVLSLSNKKTASNCCEIYKAPPKLPNLRNIFKNKLPVIMSEYHLDKKKNYCKKESTSANLNEFNFLLDNLWLENFYKIG